MTPCSVTLIGAAGIVLSATVTAAQSPPPVRPLGPIVRVSTESFAGVAAVVQLRDGHVFVNDITARRVLLFDSTLTKSSLIADSTAATGNAYGTRAGTLISYRGDTALFIDPASLSMLVLGPTGKIERIMAIPRPGDASHLIGNIYGTPGFDARGRLVYFGTAGLIGYLTLAAGQRMPPADMLRRITERADSAFVVRADLATRTLDTAASFKIPYIKTSVNGDAQGLVASIQFVVNPLPRVDDWAVCSDGSIAVVRGNDYHVDWLDANRRWTSSPKMPFAWQHVSDDRKRDLIDSTVKAEQAMYDLEAAATTTGVGSGGGRGGGSASSGGASSRRRSIAVAARANLSDLPDYVPPFEQAAVHADVSGNLWIRTTTMIKGQPVYDIVNRRGELFDRVQLPPFRTIAGFGPGVVYMAVKDSAGVVHLERARVR